MSSTPTAVSPGPQRAKGFTLIELMIVVVVAGILASIALPVYQQHLMRSRRADAQKELSAISQAQERFRSNNPSYAASLAELNYAVAGNSNYDYALSGVNTPPSFVGGYVLSATPKPSSPQARDTACSRLTLTMQAGRLDYGDDSACWPK